MGNQSIPTGDGTVSASWAVLRSASPYVIAHEYGHNLGLHHARGLDCESQIYNPSCAYSDHGTEYADWYSTMGLNFFHHNAYHKKLLGWFDPNQIIDVTHDGTYRIEPIETASTGPKMLRIATGFPQPDYIYVEYRQRLGLDNDPLLDRYGASQGVIIHHDRSNQNYPSPYSYLLDMSPESIPDQGHSDEPDFADSVLPAGEIYSNGIIAIHPDQGYNTTGINVQVSLDTSRCQTNNPVITLVPSALWVNKVFGVISWVQFKINVTNTDSLGCSESNFPWESAPDLTEKWMVQSSGSIRLRPGDTGTLEVNLKLKNGVPAGIYDYSISVYNQGDPSKRGSAPLRTYVISNPSSL